MTDPAPQYHPRYMGPCGHQTGEGAAATVCGATPTKRYLQGARCQQHTPAAMAGRPEPRPDPARSLAALRAAAGLPTAPIPTASATQAIDDRHVASGKRRSSPAAFREARDRQAGR